MNDFSTALENLANCAYVNCYNECSHLFQQTNGEPCSDANECSSGYCLGYCCDTPCDTPCMACDIGGSLGTCTYRPFDSGMVAVRDSFAGSSGNLGGMSLEIPSSSAWSVDAGAGSIAGGTMQMTPGAAMWAWADQAQVFDLQRLQLRLKARLGSSTGLLTLQLNGNTGSPNKGVGVALSGSFGFALWIDGFPQQAANITVDPSTDYFVELDALGLQLTATIAQDDYVSNGGTPIVTIGPYSGLSGPGTTPYLYVTMDDQSGAVSPSIDEIVVHACGGGGGGT
jgi:hypothetical protein